MRETGKPVEGHVDAPTAEEAFKMMSGNDIVCESLREDPRVGNYTAQAGGADAEVANAIESAFDVSSTQVNVDDLWKKYRGQRVRVIDRDKIKNRVMSVMTTAIKQSGTGDASQSKTLERVEEALTKMFGDQKNLTSEVNPQAPQGNVNETLAMLTDAVLRMEKSIAALTMAARRGGFGGGGGPSGKLMKQVRDPKNDKVLLEIFETNLDLQRQIKQKDQATTAGLQGKAAPSPSAATQNPDA